VISTSGHLIPKFPEVRFHRTRIFIKPLSEQVEECKSQLIDEVDLRVSTMVPNVLNIKVWYKNCLIIEHLTQFDVQYINNGAAG
jgi:hypothetical protein